MVIIKKTKTAHAFKHKKELISADIIKYGLNNENAARQIEANNTLVMIVDILANKPQIKKAFEELYAVKVRKVNTLITPKGKKKAYIKLLNEGDAVNVASEIGII